MLDGYDKAGNEVFTDEDDEDYSEEEEEEDEDEVKYEESNVIFSFRFDLFRIGDQGA